MLSVRSEGDAPLKLIKFTVRVYGSDLVIEPRLRLFLEPLMNDSR